MTLPTIPAISALRNYASNGKGSLSTIIEEVIKAEFVPGGRCYVHRGDLITSQEPGAPYEDLHAIVTLRGTNPRAVIAAADWMGPDMVPVLVERIRLSTNSTMQDAFIRALERIGGEEAVHALLKIIQRAVRHTHLYNSAFDALNAIASRHDPEPIAWGLLHSPKALEMWSQHRDILLPTPAGRIISHLEEIPGKTAEASLVHVISALENPMSESMIQAGVAQR